jgi:hypothetical protein
MTSLQEVGKYGLLNNSFSFLISGKKYVIDDWRGMRLDEVVDIYESGIRVGRAVKSKDLPRWHFFIQGNTYSIRNDDLRAVLSGAQTAGQIWEHVPDFSVSTGQQTLGVA